jgi:hypothetical protein
MSHEEVTVHTLVRVVAALAGLFYLTLGIWAFAAPESFGENIANYPPYNEHLIHDIGAFMLGLGAGVLAGLLLSSALAAGLAGVAVASIMHGVSHIIDSGHGGRASDPWTVTLLGVIVLLAFLGAMSLRRADRRG